MKAENNAHKSIKIYRISWLQRYCHTRNNIRQGIIFYIVLAMTAIPAGICSQQHQVPVLAMPTLEISSSDPLPELMDEEAAIQLPPFHDIIMQASATYNVDAALIRAIVVTESQYNPQAISKRGARGLMQLMPDTAKWLGIENSFDPAANIDAGVRYFRQLLDRFEGDVHLGAGRLQCRQPLCARISRRSAFPPDAQLH